MSDRGCWINQSVAANSFRQQAQDPHIKPLCRVCKGRGYLRWPSSFMHKVSQHSHWSYCWSSGGCWVPIYPCGIPPEEPLSITMTLTMEMRETDGR